MRTLSALVLVCLLCSGIAQGKADGSREGPNPRAILMREPARTAGPLVSLRDVKENSGSVPLRFFITDMGTLGGSESFAHALNDRGQAVGVSRVAGDLDTHKFLYFGGRMSDLFPLDSEHIQTGHPTDINDSGVIASGVISSGIYLPATMDTRNGTITVLPCLGGLTSLGFSGTATAINASGHVAGYCYVDGLNRRAIIYRDGFTTDLGSFGGDSAAIDINDHGVATGFASDAVSGTATAFVYNGTMTPLFGNGTESYGRAINNWGHVVGEHLTPNGTFHGFLYKNGTVTDLGSSNSPDTVPFAINDDEQVVGTKVLTFASTCSYGPCTVSKQFGFIWLDGQMALLDALVPKHLNWELSWAFDINNNGQVVGYGERNGQFHAFMMTPAINKEQCQNGAWKAFEFKSHGHCVAFVLTGD